MTRPWSGEATGRGCVMSSRPVIVGPIRAKDPFEVTLIEDDDMVEALATDGTDETLHIGRLPGRTWGDAYLLDAEAAHPAPEAFAVDGISVAQQVPGGCVKRESLYYLLGAPLGARVGGHIEVDDLAPLVPEHEEHVEYAKRCGRDGEEVNRDEVLCVIMQKGSPGL